MKCSENSKLLLLHFVLLKTVTEHREFALWKEPFMPWLKGKCFAGTKRDHPQRAEAGTVSPRRSDLQARRLTSLWWLSPLAERAPNSEIPTASPAVLHTDRRLTQTFTATTYEITRTTPIQCDPMWMRLYRVASRWKVTKGKWSFFPTWQQDPPQLKIHLLWFPLAVSSPKYADTIE